MLAATAWACTLWSCSGGGDELARPKHVFLISLDTVSAEHCSVYGYEKPTTPFLEELGARGAVFERHVVNSNNTLKSHGAIFTGMLPPAHNAYDKGEEERRRLASEYETLAERFRDAGYATAGFATHAAWLSEAFGMNQGFEHFESEWRDAPSNTNAFLEWYDAAQPERSFVFLHYFDAHSDGSEPGDQPYEAPPELIERFAGPRPADFTGSCVDRTGKQFHGSQALSILANPWREVTPEHLAYLRGTYDAGLAQLDADMRTLFDELEQRGLLDEALVVVTSDHGEEFKQHQGLLHQQFYDEVMRVPLIVTLPGNHAPGRARIDEPTRSIDLAPTMLELAGLEPLVLAQGRSFADALVNGTPIPYGDTLFEYLILRARDEDGEYKTHGDPSQKLFFDLDADPGEQHSIYDSTDAARLEEALRRLQALDEECTLVRKAVAASDGSGPPMTPEELERLQGLGYLGGAEQRGPDTDE